MKFIKVTAAESGETHLLNADAILNVVTDVDDKTVTNIFLRDKRNTCFEVKETIDEIWEMLK